MAKVTPVSGGWTVRCPACNKDHLITSPAHAFNGDVELPSFMPDVLIMDEGVICHFNLWEGTISYLDDSTHALVLLSVQL